jgi:kynurenine formamidase
VYKGSDWRSGVCDATLPRMPDSSAIARLVDISHTVEDGMVTYKGLPAPFICDYLSREASRARYADGTEFQIGKIEMIANTGTYLDSPFHRLRGWLRFVGTHSNHWLILIAS